MTNNKELVPLSHYLEIYAQADPEDIGKRANVAYESETNTFCLTFLGKDYWISWPDFTVEAADDDSTYKPLLSNNQCKILVLRYLTECTYAESAGKMITYRELPWGEVYFRQFQGRCLNRLAFSYGNKIDEFRSKMRGLGAKNIQNSDAGFAIKIFPGYPVQFLLWAGDEDFPPSAQILFSDNYALTFHPEDPVVVSEIVINALKMV